VEHYFVEGVFRADGEWNVLLGVALASFVVLRFLRKNTRILDPKNRRLEAA
jgi:hypothetical protein